MELVLVTGGTKGLGLAWSEYLAEREFKVIVTARDFDKASLVATQLNEKGRKALRMAMDVSSESSIQKVAEILDQQFGRMDIIINNAGVNPKDFKDPVEKAKAFELDHLNFDVMN